jgi:hypothetical protein
MENIFRSELFAKYARTTGNIGQVVERNGVGALCISPSEFYFGANTDENIAKSRGILGDEFKANTQYIIDFWIDTDDIYYSGVSKNVPGGFYLYYTDGTYESLVVTGNQSSPIGWQHIKCITNASKSIQGLAAFYYINTPAYYRWDSSVTEYTTSSLAEKGILSTGTLTEDSDTLTVVEGGIVQSSEFIEI